MDSLAFEAHAGLTSPRPALVAYLASRLADDAMVSEGPAELLRMGPEKVLFKLSTESREDTAIGLERMQPAERLALLRLAVDGTLPAQYPFFGYAKLLCERVEPLLAAEGAGEAEGQAGQPPPAAPWRLLPPYGRLLASWIRPGDGRLAISSKVARQPLVSRVNQTLVTLQDNNVKFSMDLKRDISSLVLQVLAYHRVGVPTPEGLFRPPVTMTELMGIPFVSYALAALDHAAATAPGLRRVPSRAAEGFRKAAAADAESQAAFMADAGLSVLLMLRHYCGHVSFDTSQAWESGLNEAVVDEVVHVAAEKVIQAMGWRYSFDLNGALLRR